MKFFILSLFVLNLPNQAYERIVSIGGSITEILYALEQGDRIVGVDTTSVFPEDAKTKAQLGYRHAINLEGILSLKPDAVFASKKYADEKLLKRLQELKLNVLVIDEQESLEGIKSKIQVLSKSLNKEEAGKKLVDQLEADFDKLEKLKKKSQQKKLVFIYARGGNRVFLSGKDTPAHKMIELAGARNGFSQAQGFKPITTESLILTNPDAIVMLKSGAKSLKDGPWGIKGIKQTTAGKNKSLILVDDLAFLGFGPRTGKSLLNLVNQLKTL